MLRVIGGNNWGLHDPEKAALYRQFVQDLHGRLSANDNSGIEFVAGQTKASHGVSQAAMIVAALFFLVFPLGLFVVTGEPKCLFLMLGGFALVSPFFGQLKTNTPRNYSPKNIPAELLP